MKAILMKSRIPFFLVGIFLTTVVAAGVAQTSDPNSLPSAPSHAKENASQGQPPASDTKAATAPEAKPAASDSANSGTAAGTAPATGSAQTPPVPAATVPDATAPATSQPETPPASDENEAVTTIRVPVNEVRVIFTVTV